MLAFYHIIWLDLIGLTMILGAIAVVAQPTVIRLRLAIKQRHGTITHWQDRVQLRFKDCGTFAYVFAWWKMRMDPMFVDLPRFLETYPQPKVAMDLGCGFGVAGNWVLDHCPQTRLYGIDPDPKRVPEAAKSYGDRGTAFVGRAPDFDVPGLPDTFDTIFCLDMIHFLTDEQLAATLQRMRQRLQPGGYLFLRSLVPPEGRGSILWRVQLIERNFTGAKINHRTAEVLRQMLLTAGFEVPLLQPSTNNPELVWFIART